MAREALEGLCGDYWYPLYALRPAQGPGTGGRGGSGSGDVRGAADAAGVRGVGTGEGAVSLVLEGGLR